MISSKQKSELKLTKKELKSYESSIQSTSLKNSQLNYQIDDLKTTLTLNQNLCLDFLTHILGHSDDEILLLFKENETLLNENKKLIERNSSCEQNIALLKEKTYTTPSTLQNSIAQLSIENDKLQNDIIKKDNEILKLKQELSKLRDKSLFKNAKNDIYVVEPTSTNVVLNHEIVANKIIIKDVIKMTKKEKEKNEDILKEIQRLEQQIKNLNDNKSNKKKAKRKGIKTSIKKGKLKSPFANKTEIKGKKEESEDSVDDGNISFKSNEKSEQESQELTEEENSSEISDDFEYMEETKGKDKKSKLKSNKKMFELISKEYNKLKAQNDELEIRIQKYKNTYLGLRNQLMKYKEGVHRENSQGRQIVEFSLASTDEKTEDKK